jgi:hypothetical protein
VPTKFIRNWKDSSKQSNLSVEKAIDILKTIYALSIQMPYSMNLKTRLIIKKEEQRILLDVSDKFEGVPVRNSIVSIWENK